MNKPVEQSQGFRAETREFRWVYFVCEPFLAYN
jgi:hypothetical protein